MMSTKMQLVVKVMEEEEHLLLTAAYLQFIYLFMYSSIHIKMVQ